MEKFSCLEELAATIVGLYEEFDDGDFSVDILVKNNARDLVTELVQYGMRIESVDVADSYIDGYDDEYIVSIYEDAVWCEKAKRDGKYIGLECDLLYVEADCDKASLEKTVADDIIKFDIEPEYCECYDCENCDMKDLCEEQDDDCDCEECVPDGMHGFSFSKESDNGSSHYSFYTTENLDKEFIEKIIKMF